NAIPPLYDCMHDKVREPIRRWMLHPRAILHINFHPALAQAARQQCARAAGRTRRLWKDKARQRLAPQRDIVRKETGRLDKRCRTGAQWKEPAERKRLAE